MSGAPKKGKPEKRLFRGSRARSVAVYLTALFLIAVLLLLLAYFMQERVVETAAAMQCFT